MLLLVLSAFGADLPARPPAPAPVSGECPRASALVAGQRPVELVDEKGVARCGGVLVPTSMQADLLATEAWAEHLEARARVDLAAADASLRAAQEREAFWRAQAERQTPAPVLLLGAGLVSGVGLTLGAAWALGQVAQ